VVEDRGDAADTAEHIRTRVLMAFERAERCHDADEQRHLMTVAVVGGGPAGR
jgi:NADH:ubiquinone reductase (H+-translocating)